MSVVSGSASLCPGCLVSEMRVMITPLAGLEGITLHHTCHLCPPSLLLLRRQQREGRPPGQRFPGQLLRESVPHPAFGTALLAGKRSPRRRREVRTPRPTEAAMWW